MPNFWSGPFEVATTDLDEIYKWGYYYDGSTNYIIDPYISYTVQDEYETVTGVNYMIQSLVKNSDTLLEVAVINSETFPNGKKTNKKDGVQEHFVQRAIFYGTNQFKTDNDLESVREAHRTKKTITIEQKIGNKYISKMFIPVNVKEKGNNITDLYGEPLNDYVLTIVSDHKLIREKLHSQFLNLGAIILILTALSVLIAFFAMKYYRMSRDKAVRVTQETYVDEINQLFQSIRAQRHDFLNHVQTIHSLAELRKSDELISYTKELTGEIRIMNDIINIGNPAIAALVRSKISQAEDFKIQFSCSFNGLNMQEMGVKTLDVNRILGNLIDNAFDEVVKYPEHRRLVELIGTQTAQHLEFIIINTCDKADEVIKKPLFESGYSTKQDDHQGIGLPIVKRITEQYKGKICVKAEPAGQLTFIVKIPL